MGSRFHYNCCHKTSKFMGVNARGFHVFMCMDKECGRIYSKYIKSEIEVCPNCGFRNDKVVII